MRKMKGGSTRKMPLAFLTERTCYETSPQPETPSIAPLFKADPAFRGKKAGICGLLSPDGKARRLLQPDEVASCCGKLARGVRGGSKPAGRESVTPPGQNRDP